MARDYRVHTVNGNLLDQFSFRSMNSTFHVTPKFLQGYQTPDCQTGPDLMCMSQLMLLAIQACLQIYRIMAPFKDFTSVYSL